jgi:hypothetical protein
MLGEDETDSTECDVSSATNLISQIAASLVSGIYSPIDGISL